MGFTSVLCRGCGLSIRSLDGMPKSRWRQDGWMTRAVLSFPSGRTVSGEYDGYGKIVPDPDPYGREPRPVSIFASRGGAKGSVYHDRCWRRLGRPGFTGASRRAPDQGFFVGDNKPRSNPSRPLRWKKVVWQHLGGWKKPRVGPEEQAYPTIKGREFQVTLIPDGKMWEILIEEFDGKRQDGYWLPRAKTLAIAKEKAQLEIDRLRATLKPGGFIGSDF